MAHRKPWLAAMGLVLLGLIPARSACANACVWTGGNSNFVDPSNWTTCGAGVPQAGDTATIPNVGSAPVISGASVDVGLVTVQTGVTLTVASGGSLTLENGLTGAGNLLVSNGGALTWTGGTMDGTGSSTAAAGSTVTLSGNAKVLGRTLTLGSGATMTGPSSLTISSGVVLHNSGTFEIQGDGGILGVGGLLDNQGTLSRTTSGTNPPIQVDVNNGGSIQVMTGGLTFTGTTTNSGTVDASGASLYYDAGTHTFDNQVLAGHIIISSALLSFNGPTTVFVSFVEGGGASVVHSHTTFTSNNLTQLDAGRFFVDPSSAQTTLGNLVVGPSAILTLGAFLPVLAASLNQQGTIEGSQDLNVSGNALWQAGLQLGPGFTRFMGTSTIGGSAVDVGRGLDLFGTSSWNTGSIGMTSAASLIRAIGAVTIDTGFTGLVGGHGKLLVLPAGSLSVTGGGGGPLTIDVPVTNSGTVTFGDRAVTLAGYSQDSGSTALQQLPGHALTVTAPVRIADGTLSGFGAINGDVTVSGSGSVSPGNVPGNPGTIAISGNYTQSAPVTLFTDSIAPIGIFSDLLSAGGTAALGGGLTFSVTFTPSAGSTVPLMTYGNRIGSFFPVTLPAAPSGLFWTARYGATTFSLVAQKLQPAFPLRVDGHAATGGVSNLNQVLDPGERVRVEPAWSNASAPPVAAVTGTFSNFTGPAGATYTISKSDAGYGTIAGSTVADCFTATGNCYELSVDNPATRPAAHWDATVDEATNDGDVTTWTLHLGGSFNDVAPAAAQYRFVETLFHNQITGGCGSGGFCPGSTVTRAQMAVFLLKAKFGPSYIPPPAIGGVFLDVPSNGFEPFIERLAALGVTAGCGNGNYCPNDSATRAQMAVFLLKTEGGPSYTPPPCVTPTFPDVPCSSGFAPWVQELVVRGITAGCGGGMYCPASAVTRGQMAVFLTTTFALALNGQ